MGRYVNQENNLFYTPNYAENTQDSNASRFACRCIYTTPGSYTFTVPAGISTITAVAVGPGGCANSIAKLSEKYVYELPECLTTCRVQYLYCCACFNPNTSFDCAGNIVNTTTLNSCFILSGRTCFRNNINSVYSQIDYAIFDSAPGGGYAEKQISTAPGCTFNIVVGSYGGNNYSCVCGQICATGPSVVSGTGISTSNQYICRCPSLSFVCCTTPCSSPFLSGSCRYECFTNNGITCYIKQFTTNSCLVAGCGFGGTINRCGGFGYKVQSYCFPLGFDDLNCDQCNSISLISTCCGCITCNCSQVQPFFGFTRTITISSFIVADATHPNLSICPLVCTDACYYFPVCCASSPKGASSCNSFCYCDVICRVNFINCGASGCTGTFTPCFQCCYFLCPGTYCGVGVSTSNFIGIVTSLDLNNISVQCNTSGGSSSGSPCFNGVYQPSSAICSDGTLCTISRSCCDSPSITSFTSCGRPVFTSWCYAFLGFGGSVTDYKLYTTYDIPAGLSTTSPNPRIAFITNTGCNPCNCSDIGCFYCTQKFDPVKNMWGIISGPACFAFGATGIGNSLALCDPIRFARNFGFCHCIFGYYGQTFPCCCYQVGVASVSHYGTSLTGISSVINCYGNNYYGGGLSVNYICDCFCASGICILANIGKPGTCTSWPTTYYPTSTCYNCFGGSCTTGIPVINLYELICDSTGKCINYCFTCGDAGKAFQVQLGEYGSDAIKAHFSPCTCSVKCFATGCSWPCYFSSVGIGTSIPCGGDSPLVPRQELTICDQRFSPNQYHNVRFQLCYCFFGNCCTPGIWGTYYAPQNQTYCNFFATATSGALRRFAIGCCIEAGAGVAYTGTTNPSGNLCCFSYFLGSSAGGTVTTGISTGTCAATLVCLCVVCCGTYTQCCTSSTVGTTSVCNEFIAVTDYGGGGGTYSGSVPTKIYRIGRCSSVIIAPSGGKGWGDYDEVVSRVTTYSPPKSQPRFNTWFDTIQAKGSGARGPVCIDAICYAPVQSGPGGGAIGGFGSPYDSTCVFGGAACAGTAGPGGGAGGQGTPGTGMVVIYWNP